MVRLPREEVLALARDAVDNGATLTSPFAVHWNAAKRCERPYRVCLEGRAERKPLPPLKAGFMKSGKLWVSHRFTPAGTPCTEVDKWASSSELRSPIWLDIDVGCRQCAACLQARGIHWRERAKVELSAASRSWFGTLTFNPEERYLVECRARTELSRATSSSERFRALHGAISKLITDYVKRVRKAAVMPLRILFVAEAHKDGFPHYHALIHEPYGHAGVVTHRILTDQWKHGFSKWKVVKDNDAAASYCAKYLFKSAMARVRASRGYGDPYSIWNLSGVFDEANAERRVKELNIPSPPEGENPESERSEQAQGKRA